MNEVLYDVINAASLENKLYALLEPNICKANICKNCIFAFGSLISS